MPLLPLLAAPLALAGGPRRQRGGIVLGLLILVVYYEALSFGEAARQARAAAPLARPLAAVRDCSPRAAVWLFLRRLSGGRPRRGARGERGAARQRRRLMVSVLEPLRRAQAARRATLILLAGLAALMMILEFLADGDKVIEAGGGVVLPVLRFTLLRLPEILAELLPVTAMLAALLTFADLSRHSELTAIYAAGISKPRLALAVLPVALLIALVQFLIADQAVPRRSAELRAWGIGDYGSAGDEPAFSWLRHGDDILRIGGFDAAAPARSRTSRCSSAMRRAT